MLWLNNFSMDCFRVHVGYVDAPLTIFGYRDTDILITMYLLKDVVVELKELGWSVLGAHDITPFHMAAHLFLSLTHRIVLCIPQSLAKRCFEKIFIQADNWYERAWSCLDCSPMLGNLVHMYTKLFLGIILVYNSPKLCAYMTKPPLMWFHLQYLQLIKLDPIRKL